MATLEERLNSLAQDYATAIQAVVVKLDEHATAQREQGRNIRALSLDVREMGLDMREVKARLATMDTRLNRMDEKFDSLREQMDQKFEQVNQKFEQVIALLSPRTPDA